MFFVIPKVKVIFKVTQELDSEVYSHKIIKRNFKTDIIETAWGLNCKFIILLANNLSVNYRLKYIHKK